MEKHSRTRGGKVAHPIIKMACLHTSNRWQKRLSTVIASTRHTQKRVWNIRKDQRQIPPPYKEKARRPPLKRGKLKEATCFTSPFKKGKLKEATCFISPLKKEKLKEATCFTSPFKKGKLKGATCFISPFLKGVAAFLFFAAGGFAFSFLFSNKLVFKSVFCFAKHTPSNDGVRTIPAKMLIYATPLLKIGLGLSLCLASFFAQALPSNTFNSPAQEKQFQTLSEELRCLVCQNESIWDSQAPLAKDLRTEIYKKVKAGESAEEIKAYLVARYGQFILFKPAFNGATYLLWGTPFLLLLCGFLIVGFMVRRSRAIQK
jgi:cytochrome c-type biogenesis protein CcmH